MAEWQRARLIPISGIGSSKESERRAQHVTETVEAEAMPAQVMREILRERIEALLPANALAVAKAAEESERDILRLLAQRADEEEPDDD